METLSFYNLLSYGASGLGCILAVLAYFLLRDEQKQPKPRKQFLTSIYIFMVFSLALSLFGFGAELWRHSGARDAASGKITELQGELEKRDRTIARLQEKYDGATPPDDPPSQTNRIVDLYSGTDGGVFYDLAKRLAKAIEKQPKSPYRVQSIPTQGSADNCDKIKNGKESVLGLAFISDLHDDPCSESIALVSPLYSGVWYLPVRTKAIRTNNLPLNESYNDDEAICNILNNIESIYIGGKKSGTQGIANYILEQCKVPEKVKRIEDLGYGQVSNRLTKKTTLPY